MTKKDLERRNKFLLLQIKIIKELLEDYTYKTEEEQMRALGAIYYYTDPRNIKKAIETIEDFDETYNFYNKTMNIKEYE